jgi:hypothetical protein
LPLSTCMLLNPFTHTGLPSLTTTPNFFTRNDRKILRDLRRVSSAKFVSTACNPCILVHHDRMDYEIQTRPGQVQGSLTSGPLQHSPLHLNTISTLGLHQLSDSMAHFQRYGDTSPQPLEHSWRSVPSRIESIQSVYAQVLGWNKCQRTLSFAGRARYERVL